MQSTTPFLYVPTVPTSPLICSLVPDQPPMSASASLPALFSSSAPILALPAPPTPEPSSPINEDEFELLHPPTTLNPDNSSTRLSALAFLTTIPLPPVTTPTTYPPPSPTRSLDSVPSP